MNNRATRNTRLQRGGICALAVLLAACGQGQNNQASSGPATSAAAPAASASAAPGSANATGPQPTPISFPSKFGSLSFPDKFPAGTTLSITQWSHFVPRYDKWFDQYAQKWGEANSVMVLLPLFSPGVLVPTLSAAIAAK